MREFVFFMVGIFFGGFIGVVTMCLVQINNCGECHKDE